MSEALEILDDVDFLLGLDDRPVEYLDVPEWNRRVRLRGMTALDRDAFEQHTQVGGENGGPNLLGYRAKMVAACWVKEDGSRVVDPTRESVLNNLGAKGMDRVFQKCAEMNGMSDGAQEKAKENFGSGQNAS